MNQTQSSLSNQHGSPSGQTSSIPSSDGSINSSDNSNYQINSESTDHHGSLPTLTSSYKHLYEAEPSPIEGYTRNQLLKLVDSQSFKEFLYGTGCQTDQQISIAIKEKVMKTYHKHGSHKAAIRYQYLSARSRMKDREVSKTDIYYVTKAIEAYEKEKLIESGTYKHTKKERQVLEIPDPIFIIRREGEHDHQFSQDYAIDVTNFCRLNKDRLGTIRGNLCFVIERSFPEKIVCHRGTIISASQCVVPYHGIIEGIADFRGMIKVQIDSGGIANLLDPHLDVSYSIQQVISLNFCKHVITSLMYDLRNITRLFLAMNYISNSENVDSVVLRRWAYFTGGRQLDIDVFKGYFKTPNELIHSMITPFRCIFKDLQDSYSPVGWDVQGFFKRNRDKRWIFADSFIFGSPDIFSLNVKSEVNDFLKQKKRRDKLQAQDKRNQYKSLPNDESYQEILKEGLTCYPLSTLRSMRQSMLNDLSSGRPIDHTKYSVVNDLILDKISKYTINLPNCGNDPHIDRESSTSSPVHPRETKKRTHGMDIESSVPKLSVQRPESICYDGPKSTVSDGEVNALLKQEGREDKHQNHNKQSQDKSPSDNESHQGTLEKEPIHHSTNIPPSMKQSVPKDQNAEKSANQIKHNVVNDPALDKLSDHTGDLFILKNSYVDRESEMLSPRYSGNARRRVQEMNIKSSVSKVNMRRSGPIHYGNFESTGSDANKNLFAEEKRSVTIGSDIKGNGNWTFWNMLRRRLLCC